MAVGFGNQFLYATPKAGFMKEKCDNLDFIKTKSFCSLKETVK